MPITMFDSVDVSTVPDNPQAVAGYVGGSWPTYNGLVARFPNAHHLSIAVNASEDADCLDVETGDATPDQAGPWARRQINRGVHRPVLYSDRSEHPAVAASVAAVGLGRADVRYWIATLDGVQPADPGSVMDADAVQWTDKALGRNLDQSICRDDFFGPPPPPPDPHHYAFFATGPFPSKWGPLNERQVVLQYDGARAHPHLYALYLHLTLRPKLKFLADRVAFEALQNHPASWGVDDRGWRYQQLLHRSQGKRLA